MALVSAIYQVLCADEGSLHSDASVAAMGYCILPSSLPADWGAGLTEYTKVMVRQILDLQADDRH